MGFKRNKMSRLSLSFALPLRKDFITSTTQTVKTIQELLKSVDQILFACNVCFWSNNVSDETYLTSVFRLRWQNEKRRRKITNLNTILTLKMSRSQNLCFQIEYSLSRNNESNRCFWQAKFRIYLRFFRVKYYKEQKKLSHWTKKI